MKSQLWKQAKAGMKISIEDTHFQSDPHAKIEPGDFYIAERNVGPKLLTCRKIVYVQNDGSLGDERDTGSTDGIVYPSEIAYPYNESECVKVRMLDS